MEDNVQKRHTLEHTLKQHESEHRELLRLLKEQKLFTHQLQDTVKQLEKKAEVGKEDVEQRRAKQRAISDWYST
jgi:hypothetical protein